MRPVRLIVLCAGLLAAGAVEVHRSSAADISLPANVFAVSPEDEIQDVVFFAESHPVFVRFHVRVGNLPFNTAWGEFVVGLHRYLDDNGDGSLTVKEAQRTSWQQALLQGPFGPRRGMPAGRATPANLDADKDGKVSVGELANYVRSAASFEAFGVQPGPGADPKTQALFAHLDLDHDGRLSSQELAATDDCLRRLDLDEDELLSPGEMLPYQNAYAEQFRGVNMNTSGFNPDTAIVVAIAPGDREGLKKLAQRIIAKYDRGSAEPKGGLRQAELDVDTEPFRRADSNGDGLLNLAELETFLLKAPAHLEFNLVLPAKNPGEVKFEQVGSGASPSAHKLTTQKRGNSGPIVELDGLSVEFTSLDNQGGARQFYLQRFKQADADNNGYLEKKELDGVPFFQQVFPVADRNNDGKLYEKELVAFIDVQEDATASRIGLTISDRGRALFDVLDTNQDQRLCLRELRKARSLLEKLDRNGDDQLGPLELPHQYQLTTGRGQVPFRRGISFDSYASPPASQKGKAPTWFTRMDRNQDGDLSPREFLGSAEEFQQFDADDDGLIDPQEAAKAP